MFANDADTKRNRLNRLTVDFDSSKVLMDRTSHTRAQEETARRGRNKAVFHVVLSL